MKVNLLYGVIGKVQTGYLNIYPFAEEETEHVQMGDIQNLDQFVCDAEATEIIAIDVLDYVELPKITNVLDHWSSKLRKGGKLILGCTDGYIAAKAFADYKISVEEFNIIIHGSQEMPHLIKRVSLTMAGLTKYLETVHNLKVIKKRYDGYGLIIEAERK